MSIKVTNEVQTYDNIDALVGLPPVLDVCCGPRMMWINKHDPRAVYFDKRDEDFPIEPNAAYPNGTTLKVRPDVCGDFTDLTFPEDSFRLVVMDPPHYTKIGMTGVLGKTYGKLLPGWEDVLSAGFRECFRVLKPEGVLIFKWCSVEIPLAKVLALSPYPPLFGHNTGNRAKTHWMTFMKPT
jgi:SAM-dependent methyltransferase